MCRHQSTDFSPTSLVCSPFCAPSPFGWATVHVSLVARTIEGGDDAREQQHAGPGRPGARPALRCVRPPAEQGFPVQLANVDASSLSQCHDPLHSCRFVFLVSQHVKMSYLCINHAFFFSLMLSSFRVTKKSDCLLWDFFFFATNTLCENVRDLVFQAVAFFM